MSVLPKVRSHLPFQWLATTSTSFHIHLRCTHLTTLHQKLLCSNYHLLTSQNMSAKLTSEYMYTWRMKSLKHWKYKQTRPLYSMLNVPQLHHDQKEHQGQDADEILKNLSEDVAKKLKIIKLEFEVMEQMYGKVPEQMTESNWLHALTLESRSQRKDYYRILWTKQEREKETMRKKQLRAQQLASEMTDTDHSRHSESHLLLKLQKRTILKFENFRLLRAMMFGQPLVIDMDYEMYMRQEDCHLTVHQLMMAYSLNRSFIDPFHLVFTSVNPNGIMFPFMKHQKFTGKNLLGSVTDKSYLDLFPREKLVYLSPHARDELHKISNEDIYIVGAFVDKACQNKHVSLARAKEQGIRAVKFPLDRYLQWNYGSKSLHMDQVVSILLQQRRYGDWKKSFQAVPSKKFCVSN